MFDFCPHCGHTIEQEQIPGRMLVCERCGKDIGFVGTVQRSAIGTTEQQLRAGEAAICPVCQQAVELKGAEAARTLVPHYAAGAKKICPGSGKRVTPELTTPGGKDLRALMTRDVVKLLYCPRHGEPRIEIVTLEYLDKSERVRIQIEALREMLGHDFRMSDYPARLGKPHLSVWAGADARVVAAKHDQGGYQSIADADVLAAIADLRGHQDLFREESAR